MAEHPAALVAGLTYRDLLRRPGGWVATLLTGALFALLVGAVGLSGERSQDRVENRSFVVAVGGDLDGARQVLQELADPRFDLRELDSAAAVAEQVTGARAAAGIVFPPAVDRRLDAGEQVDLELYDRQSTNVSVEAFNLIGVRLQEIQLARLAAARGEAVVPGRHVEVDVLDLPRDARLNRIQLGQQLAPIAALLGIGMVTSVAAVLGAARERRSIEPLLVLPLSRRSIMAGTAFGAFPLAALQIVAAVSLLVLTAAIPASSATQAAGTVAAMVAGGTAAALLLALVATGFGCLAGALGTGSDDAVSLGDLVAVLFVVVGVIAFSAPTLGMVTWAYAVPILGQTLLIGAVVGGTATPAAIGLAVASALGTFAVLVVVAGDRLDDERRVARAIR